MAQVACGKVSRLLPREHHPVGYFAEDEGPLPLGGSGFWQSGSSVPPLAKIISLEIFSECFRKLVLYKTSTGLLIIAFLFCVLFFVLRVCSTQSTFYSNQVTLVKHHLPRE